MNEWMMNELMNEWMEKWINEWIDWIIIKYADTYTVEFQSYDGQYEILVKQKNCTI